MEDDRDPMQLPIDISYSKLAEWLVDRKKVPADWRKRVASIHSRISSALSVLPRGVDPWRLSLTPDCTGYLEAKRIRDILSSEGPESRNMFGRLAGAAGEWDAIVSAFEKDLLHLGEGAQIMVQNTNYEIPFQKKQISKLQQQLADLERKEGDAKRHAAQSVLKYSQACQELGVLGVNVRSELLALGKLLPSIFAKLLEILCSSLVGQALEYYKTFVSSVHNDHEVDCWSTLPTLADLHNNPPDVLMKSTQQKIDLPVQDGVQLAEQMLQPDLGTLEIDWDFEVIPVETDDAVDINWDINDVEPPSAYTCKEKPDSATGEEKQVNQTGGLHDNSEPWEQQSIDEIQWIMDDKTNPEEIMQDIDWDIEVQDSLIDDPESLLIPEEDNKALSSKPDDGTTFEALPSSCFVEVDYRNKLLNDLFELKAFLKQRVVEMENEETAALQNQVQAIAPTAFQQHGSASLMAMVDGITQALDLLTNRRTRDLILITTSTRFVDRLEASLVQKKQNEMKLQQNIKDLSSKRIELRSALSSLWPKQEALLTRTKQVKLHVEETLSSQYKGRTVNIIGEINTLLS